MTALDLCAKLVKPYLDRGDSTEAIRHHRLGYYDDEMDVATVRPGIFEVSRLNGESCHIRIPLEKAVRRALESGPRQQELFA